MKYDSDYCFNMDQIRVEETSNGRTVVEMS